MLALKDVAVCSGPPGSVWLDSVVWLDASLRFGVAVSLEMKVMPIRCLVAFDSVPGFFCHRRSIDTSKWLLKISHDIANFWIRFSLTQFHFPTRVLDKNLKVEIVRCTNTSLLLFIPPWVWDEQLLKKEWNIFFANSDGTKGGNTGKTVWKRAIHGRVNSYGEESRKKNVLDRGKSGISIHLRANVFAGPNPWRCLYIRATFLSCYFHHK